MGRPPSKRADNDATTAAQLKQLRAIRKAIRCTMKEISDEGKINDATVSALFYDTELSKRYHTASNINRALSAIRRLQRKTIRGLKLDEI
jgi:hypothetical protein